VDDTVPPAVVADIRRGSDPGKFAKAGYALLTGYSYRGMWWASHNALGAFEARGIHGQRLYVAPAAENGGGPLRLAPHRGQLGQRSHHAAADAGAGADAARTLSTAARSQ
jgi:CubicO group peptidase (beta-lactamase class C family)